MIMIELKILMICRIDLSNIEIDQSTVQSYDLLMDIKSKGAAVSVSVSMNSSIIQMLRHYK